MSSSSSQYLPTELLLEILSRVPVKDLIRFRCVSKWWSSIVFDPTLVKLHLQRSSKNTHILLTFEDHTTTDPSHEMIFCAAACSIHGLLENPSSTVDGCLNHGYLVLDVCNGLVCVYDFYLVDELQEFGFKFWNPATRLMSGRLDLPQGFQKLGFGFGYDDWSDTYKLVALFADIKSQKTEVRVYCLGDTCWRNILTCPAHPIPEDEDGQFVSGTVNWLALCKFGSEYPWRYQSKTVSINQLVIFSYDLRNETYRYLSMPDGLIEVPTRGITLDVLKGCLCLCHGHGTHSIVWLMREFGVDNSWTQLLKISHDHYPVILSMSENEDVMLLATCNPAGSEIILYNKRDKAIDRHKAFFSGKYSFLSYDYVQSMVVPY